MQQFQHGIYFKSFYFHCSEYQANSFPRLTQLSQIKCIRAGGSQIYRVCRVIGAEIQKGFE